MTNDPRRARPRRHVVTFPDGRVGAGLLILRGAVAFGAVVIAIEASAGTSFRTVGPRDLAVCLVAGAVLAGCFTGPATGVLAALALAIIAGTTSPSSIGALLLPTAVAVMFTGPGAYSVDARRHGRREIVVPRGPSRVDRT